ncbi:serine-aspartate repeat-containing protein C-like [Helianthus annuus]|uniref:serine-aspartate repeat-containing protein C-like n=1 Tax=Helianthus annuus TaxID=4232 RepID=UPI000B90612B|nr:serine-aspartate repeat-containing protein C-like [Helianthus annuus]
MPTPHPENDLIDKKASVEQNESCGNETTANFSKSNADPIVCKEDVCNEDGDCGGSKIGIGYSGDSYSAINWFAWNCSRRNNLKEECNDLSRMDDCNGRVPKFKSSDNCKGHVPTFETRDREDFVSEQLKKNSFGKFLTEEIPEFIPSRTCMTDSEKSVTEDHFNGDSSITALEDEQKSESSNEDQTTDGESLEFLSEETPKTSSEDQNTNDESSKCSSVETIEDQDSESSNEDQSYYESSYEASEEQSSSEDNTYESSSDSDSDEEYSED